LELVLAVGRWPVFGDMHVTHPGVTVLGAELGDVRVTVDFDIVFGLGDIDAIEDVDKTLSFEWDAETLINLVE